MPGERRFISLSLPAPGAGAGMPADRWPQPWQETRSPALARLPFLMGAEGEAGQDGWQAAPPGQRLLTDGKRRRSPRLNRKPAGAAAGPRGAPRAPLPRAPSSPRARRWLARPLPLARSPPLARPLPLARPVSLARPAPLRARGSPRARRLLSDSREPPRREEGGGGQAEGGRWPRLRRPGRGGRAGSKLGAAAGRPGREEALGDPWSVLSRRPGPALSLFPLLSFLRPLFAVAPPDSEPAGAGVGPTDAAAPARWPPGPDECLC